jgi:glutaconate CoA-transferase subunit B
MLGRGRFDVSFESAAQVDRYGNLNITQIDARDGKQGKRLIGCLAQPEHLAFVGKPIIVVDLNRRTFIDEVDYVTSFGHQHAGIRRTQYALRGPGPQLCVTDKAVFDFEGHDGAMRLRSMHPGVTLDEVRGSMAFEVEVAGELEQTQPPSDAQITTIRASIDPDRALLRA